MQYGSGTSSLFFDDRSVALSYSIYEPGAYGFFEAHNQDTNAFDASGEADETGVDTPPRNDQFHPVTAWVDDLFEKKPSEQDEQERVEATARTCRHGRLMDASRRLLDGTVLLCNECLPAESVNDVGDVPAPNKARDAQMDEFLSVFMDPADDDEASEAGADIEERHQGHSATAPVPPHDAPLDAGDREDHAPEIFKVHVSSPGRMDTSRAREGEAADGDDEGDDAVSSYSERSSAPGPSKRSAAGSGAARSSTKPRGRKADAVASSNNTTVYKPLDRTKSAAGKDAETMKKTDIEHYARSYGRALSLLDRLEDGNAADDAMDAALLAAEPYDPLPLNCTPPPPPTSDVKLSRQEVRNRREARQSFCIVCQMQFAKLRGASYYQEHRTVSCALWRVLVACDLATRWLELHEVDKSICSRMQFEAKYKAPGNKTYRTMANDKCEGYDAKGWQTLGAQLRDGEAKAIKAKLPREMSALRVAIAAERDARLVTIRAASSGGTTTTATTSTGPRKRRADDEEHMAGSSRGLKRRKGEESA